MLKSSKRIFTSLVVVDRVVAWIHEDLEGEFQFDITIIHYLQSKNTNKISPCLISSSLPKLLFTIMSR